METYLPVLTSISPTASQSPFLDMLSFYYFPAGSNLHRRRGQFASTLWLNQILGQWDVY